MSTVGVEPQREPEAPDRGILVLQPAAEVAELAGGLRAEGAVDRQIRGLEQLLDGLKSRFGALGMLRCGGLGLILALRRYILRESDLSQQVLRLRRLRHHLDRLDRRSTGRVELLREPGGLRQRVLRVPVLARIGGNGLLQVCHRIREVHADDRAARVLRHALLADGVERHAIQVVELCALVVLRQGIDGIERLVRATGLQPGAQHPHARGELAAAQCIGLLEQRQGFAGLAQRQQRATFPDQLFAALLRAGAGARGGGADRQRGGSGSGNKAQGK